MVPRSSSAADGVRPLRLGSAQGHMPSDAGHIIICHDEVRHKASATEGCDEGVTWWARACSADREAIVLLKPEDAETLLQSAGRYRRPPKPRAQPLVLLYRDGAWAGSPSASRAWSPAPRVLG